MNHSLLTVTLPDIGEGVVEGEVIAWLKQVGDKVNQDEPVVVVMTDKATVELPAPQPGVITKHHFKVGELALRDKPLYDIEMNQAASDKKQTLASSTENKIDYPPLTPTAAVEKILASPATRCAARELGVDIQKIEGTGKEGRVTRADLPRHKASKTIIPRFEGDTEEPMNGIRQLMAEKMSESVRIVPHFSYFEQADVTRLVQLKTKLSQEASQEGISLTFMPFFIRALSMCINKFPLFNSSLDSEKNVIVLHKPHNIGVAMATHFGLIVPVIKHVEKMSMRDIIHAYEEVKKKAFENKLQSSDMKEGTLTLTNFGALPGASLGGTPIINYPEAAICGVARILKMPKVVNNEVVIRELMNVSSSFDHRIIDGQLAAKISSEFCHLLENPAQLL